jgi:hypothetical protein
VTGWGGVTPIGQLQSAQLLRSPATADTVFFTFPSPGQVWAAILSYTVAAGTGYAGGPQAFFAQINDTEGLILAVVELSITDLVPNDSGQSNLSVPPGSYFDAGDTLELNVNEGLALAGGLMRASAAVLYTLAT